MPHAFTQVFRMRNEKKREAKGINTRQRAQQL
jgi:stalled ribosome alternative rescue factor ArfA